MSAQTSAAQRLADARRRFLAAHAIGADPAEDALPAAISRAELREMLVDAIGVGFYAAPMAGRPLDAEGR